MEIKIKIPDGEYCENCPFVHEYTHNLVDIMGNETGHTKSGTICSRFNTELETHIDGCFFKVKKCDWCQMTDKEREMKAFLYFSLFKMITNDVFGKQAIRNGKQTAWIYTDNDETGKEYKCLCCSCLIGVPDGLECYLPESCPKCKSKMIGE